MDEATTGERRLSANARRTQLVEVAYRLLRQAPLRPLSPESVAAEAGVSKPLVFHYFPTVSDLQLAVFEQVADDLLERLDVGTAVPFEARLRRGIEAFVDYASEHADLYLHLVRGGGSDNRLHLAMDRARDRVARLIGRGLGVEDPSPALLVVLRGHLGMIEEAVLEWLDGRPVTRDALVEFLCAATEQMQPAAMALVARTRAE